MKDSMKTWKIAAGVAAGILAAAGVVWLIVRNLQQLKELAREVRELCFRTEQEFGYGDACCYCGEEETEPQEEPAGEDVTEEEAEPEEAPEEAPEEEETPEE